MGKLSENTIDYYIQPNKVMCSMYGLWPTDGKCSTSNKVLAIVHLVISVIIVCTIFVPEIIILSSKWRDLSVLAGTSCIIIALAQLLFKTVYLMAKRDTAYRLLQELRSLWDSTDDPIERQSYEMFAYWGRTSTIAFFFSGIGCSSIFMLTATVDCLRNTGNSNISNRHIPYDVWRELDFLESPEFEVIYACQIIASFNCCCAICGLDGMCVATILQVSGQFRLIATWLTNVGIEMNCESNDPHNFPAKVTADLSKCIRHHQRLTKVVKDINALLIPIVFIQILTSGIQICLSGFAVFSNSAKDDLVKFITYLAAMTIQLTMYCWPGEILIQESEEIASAAYLNVPWYQLPPAKRRQFIMIIMNSQQGCCISALTFKSISSYTLTSVFNASSSYFALLRQIQESSAGR